MFNGMLGKLLQKQRGKCRWCGLLYQDGDSIEIDHIIPKSHGGGEEIRNKCVLHRHCHDQRHAQRVKGTYDRGHIIEELDDAKVSCPVCAVRRCEIFLPQTGRTREEFLSYQLT